MKIVNVGVVGPIMVGKTSLIQRMITEERIEADQYLIDGDLIMLFTEADSYEKLKYRPDFIIVVIDNHTPESYLKDLEKQMTEPFLIVQNKIEPREISKHFSINCRTGWGIADAYSLIKSMLPSICNVDACHCLRLTGDEQRINEFKRIVGKHHIYYHGAYYIIREKCDEQDSVVGIHFRGEESDYPIAHGIINVHCHIKHPIKHIFTSLDRIFDHEKRRIVVRDKGSQMAAIFFRTNGDRLTQCSIYVGHTDGRHVDSIIGKPKYIERLGAGFENETIERTMLHDIRRVIRRFINDGVSILSNNVAFDMMVLNKYCSPNDTNPLTMDALWISCPDDMISYLPEDIRAGYDWNPNGVIDPAEILFNKAVGLTKLKSRLALKH
jgi:hypothetical protein